MSIANLIYIICDLRRSGCLASLMASRWCRAADGFQLVRSGIDARRQPAGVLHLQLQQAVAKTDDHGNVLE